MAARLKAHPVLSILPQLEPRELEVAIERVGLYGQRDVIEALRSGEIVAGVVEWQACVGAKLSPRVTIIREPDDLVEFVVRRNVPRDLTRLDRACIGVLAQEEWMRLAHERKRIGGSIGGKAKGKAKLRVGVTRTFEGSRWFEEAARVLGTSAGAIKGLAAIRRNAPDVFDAVRARKLVILRDARDLAQALPTVKARAKVLALREERQDLPVSRCVADVMRAERTPLVTTPAAARGRAWVVHEGPMAREGRHIQDATVDMVLADLVYGDRAMAVELAKLAARVLTEGGVLAMIAGVNMLAEMNAVAEYLTPRAIGGYYVRGNSRSRLPGLIKRADFLPVAFFGKGRLRSIAHLAFVSEQKDVDQYGWGKNVAATLDIIQSCVPPGARILDPCCGSGTTGEAALKHACEFIGIDIDPKAAAASRSRLTAVEREIARSKPGIKRAG
jgi:hypothetical protein